MDKLIMAASNISELKSNRKYFSVSMRMFSTRPNLNKCAVTEAFIDDIIANKGDYVCMPLCADVAKLKRKDYRGLTHMQDKNTGTFLAEEIGGFYDFEKISDEFGASLIGYARINKRSSLVCEAIQDLYDNNALNFSFEISAGVVNIVDGISVVDANEENELTAMAVVSIPAYPESKALDLVAEADEMTRFYANANMQISEMDIEVVRRRFHEALYEMMGDKIYRYCTLLFCHDCVILYDYEDGKTYKAEYMMDNDNLMIKDFYMVDFVRSEGSETEMKISEQEAIAEEMNLENHETAEAAAAEETVVEAEVKTDETKDTSAEIAEEIEDEKGDEAEDAKGEPDEENDEKEDKLAEALKKCADLEAEIEALKQFKEELDQMKEEKLQAEAEAKKASLREYAESEGLSAKETVIAEAIENLDYEKIVAEVTANKSKAKEQKKGEGYFAAYTDIGVGGFSYLLKSR